MDNCGPACILFIWAGFLWPIIVSGFFLIIKRDKIISKRKYFLVSTFGGYVLLIGFNFFIGFVARIYIDPNGDAEMKTIVMVTTMILLLPPVVLSHVLSKKYS